MLIENLRVRVRIFFVFDSIIHWNDEFDYAVKKWSVHLICGLFVNVLSVGINDLISKELRNAYMMKIEAVYAIDSSSTESAMFLLRDDTVNWFTIQNQSRT